MKTHNFIFCILFQLLFVGNIIATEKNGDSLATQDKKRRLDPEVKTNEYIATSSERSTNSTFSNEYLHPKRTKTTLSKKDVGGCADEYTVEERKLFEIWGEIRNEYKLPDINESYNIENIIHNSIKLINNSKNEQLIKDIHKKLQKFRKHDFLSIKRYINLSSMHIINRFKKS